jgi:hypothetical protein
MSNFDFIITVLFGVCAFYISVRLIFYAISKSWHEAKKHVEKEESNELQKVSKEEERRPTKKT